MKANLLMEGNEGKYEKMNNNFYTIFKSLDVKSPYWVDFDNFDQRVNNALNEGYKVLALSHYIDNDLGRITMVASLYKDTCELHIDSIPSDGSKISEILSKYGKEDAESEE